MVIGSTYFRVEEQGVHAPRERLLPLVHISVLRCRLVSMLVLDVLHVGVVLVFNLLSAVGGKSDYVQCQ